ncbi:hypothetical protein [Castellaniella sp.]|uniref:hypothetical protein n=1 Tax=Castellaniella sp. TaxID=1955812 RepID=UPI00355F953B
MDTVAGLGPMQDAALIEQAANGHVPAFDQLMRRYNQRMYRAARSILADERDAEEALQEPFQQCMAEAFSFAGERCDRIVAGVHRRMRDAGILQGD